jgi:hypothetical protein
VTWDPVKSRRPTWSYKNISLGKDHNPAGAKWCEHHSRLECDGKRKDKSECHMRAIKGTKRCRMHSGMSLAKARAKGEQVVTAWTAQGRLEKQIDHQQAVMSVLQMTWLRLSVYSEMLRRQVLLEGGLDPDTPQVQRQPDGEAETDGLIGFRYGAAGKDGVVYVQSEEIRALVDLEGRERDRVVKYAEVAHRMGIQSKMTDMAERWGDIIATRISVMLEALVLTAEQQAMVPALLQAHLSSIELEMGGTTIEGELLLVDSEGE